ncbi:hypothetical protein HYALB_00002779 [Hymenoscyphus albidus]|uniref:Uncharacterized protein n=1 Tax=Hymenoscyphus albidus TaxID=595503 RepID=A0A9N9LJQ2_9HELO|nr:hypothetical protein HYALB_00002779 [Hymenoscyphus albidus]
MVFLSKFLDLGWLGRSTFELRFPTGSESYLYLGVLTKYLVENGMWPNRTAPAGPWTTNVFVLRNANRCNPAFYREQDEHMNKLYVCGPFSLRPWCWAYCAADSSNVRKGHRSGTLAQVSPPSVTTKYMNVLDSLSSTQSMFRFLLILFGSSSYPGRWYVFSMLARFLQNCGYWIKRSAAVWCCLWTFVCQGLLVPSMIRYAFYCPSGSAMYCPNGRFGILALIILPFGFWTLRGFLSPDLLDPRNQAFGTEAFPSQ